MSDDKHKKIIFTLEQDEDGYPPNDYENLWAEDLGNNLYKIDNTPFYIQGISWKDVVSVTIDGEELCFNKVVERSKHSTIRVILFDTSLTKSLRSELEKMGCSSELSHVPDFIAVDVPPEVVYEKVREFLDDGERKENWEYEESALRH